MSVRMCVCLVFTTAAAACRLHTLRVYPPLRICSCRCVAGQYPHVTGRHASVQRTMTWREIRRMAIDRTSSWQSKESGGRWRLGAAVQSSLHFPVLLMLTCVGRTPDPSARSLRWHCECLKGMLAKHVERHCPCPTMVSRPYIEGAGARPPHPRRAAGAGEQRHRGYEGESPIAGRFVVVFATRSPAPLPQSIAFPLRPRIRFVICATTSGGVSVYQDRPEQVRPTGYDKRGRA